MEMTTNSKKNGKFNIPEKRYNENRKTITGGVTNDFEIRARTD